MFCLAATQLAVRAVLRSANEESGPGAELSKLQPPDKTVLPPHETIESEVRALPIFDGLPVNPVVDAELAASLCAANCASIPNGSYFDVPAPDMFERGVSCDHNGVCVMDPPSDMAQKQHDSFIKKLGLNANSKIAVVGSSGALKHRADGAAIDSHDIVVRINGAPTNGGVAAMVGNRTDVAWCANEGLLSFARSIAGTGFTAKGTAPVVLFAQIAPCASKENRGEMLQWARDQLPPGKASGVWAVDADIGCTLWRGPLMAVASKFPSTGMTAVGFFSKLAKSLGAMPPSVFGFGGNTNNCAKYYDCRGGGVDYKGNNWHPFATEQNVLQEWHTNGMIKLIIPLAET